jgi:hypothetical protein
VIPSYLRITRAGNDFRTFVSTDGNTFTQIGTTQTLALPTTLRVGLVVTSHTSGTLATATFTNVTITGAGGGTLTAPTGLAATAGDGHVSLSWSPVTGASSYTVRRSSTAGGPYTVLASGAAGTTYLDAIVNNNAALFYVVSARNDATESANSAEVSATPTGGTDLKRLAQWGFFEPSISSATPRPANQAWFSVTAGNLTKSAALAAGPNADSTFWAEGWPSVATGTIDTSRYFEFSLGPNPGYTMSPRWIRFSLYGEEGPGSWELRSSADNFAAPLAQGSYASGISAPTGMHVDADVSALGDRTSTVTFRFYAYDNEGWPPGDNDPANFRRGFRGSARGGHDLEIWGRAFIPGGAFPAPSGLKGQAADRQAHLSWSAVPGATGYTVKRAAASAGPYTTIATAPGTSYVDSGLTNETVYYYTVASNNGPSPGPDSTWVQVIPHGLAAGTIATWSFLNQTVDSALPYPPFTFAQNTTAGSITKSAALGSTQFLHHFAARDWPGPGTTVDTAKYIELSMTAAAGRSIAYTSINGRLGNNFEGPTSWQIRSSADNFATVVASGSAPSGLVSKVSFDANISAVGTRSGTVTFRMYMYATGGTSEPTQRGLYGSLEVRGTVF